MLFPVSIDEFWYDLLAWLPVILVVVQVTLLVVFFNWVLLTKTDSTSAAAWCLLIFFLPIFGAALFYFLGYQHVDRPLRRKRRHKLNYQGFTGRTGRDVLELTSEHADALPEHAAELYRELHLVASRSGAYPVTLGNSIDFYHEGNSAFDAMKAEIRSARHHIHLLTFIFQRDEVGSEFLNLLTTKAREGVTVRLLYDAMGTRRLTRKLLKDLVSAGGRAIPFLPLDPMRRRMQINLRNHRKIMVVDGQVGYVGGLNVGDEYLGRVQRFGYWRDTHLRIEGPAVADLQRVFAEDWDFACGQQFSKPDDREAEALYYQPKRGDGPYAAQIIDSGPDRDIKGIREVYFAAILKARKRVWIASPYFVPDAGLLDALRLAGRLGVDVRFLGQHYPDHVLAQYAARYYWRQVLPSGVKVYQYTKGMMHSKVVMVDGLWASVGTANLDNRSLHLNFEVNCLLYSRSAVAELEAAYELDLQDSIRLDRDVYARRPFAGQFLENAARMFSPIL